MGSLFTFGKLTSFNSQGKSPILNSVIYRAIRNYLKKGIGTKYLILVTTIVRQNSKETNEVITYFITQIITRIRVLAVRYVNEEA